MHKHCVAISFNVFFFLRFNCYWEAFYEQTNGNSGFLT
jgi:hypothetical protein